MGISLNTEERRKVKILTECVVKAKPVGLVGKYSTGKSQYIKLVVKHILNKSTVYFNSLTLGSFRDLYGIYDPFSTTQQTMEQ